MSRGLGDVYKRQDLEGEFKRFEEKHLIEQVAETEKVKADGTKEMIYKIVF